MLQEHKRLDKFLDILERDLDDYEKTKKNFECLKWNLEKHFFVEEKVIFDSFVSISGQETNDTFSLLEDHVRIIELLNKHEKKIIKVECLDFDKYGRLLIKAYNNVDELSINEIMVNEGHGRAYDGGRKDTIW